MDNRSQYVPSGLCSTVFCVQLFKLGHAVITHFPSNPHLIWLRLQKQFSRLRNEGEVTMKWQLCAGSCSGANFTNASFYSVMLSRNSSVSCSFFPQRYMLITFVIYIYNPFDKREVFNSFQKLHLNISSMISRSFTNWCFLLAKLIYFCK